MILLRRVIGDALRARRQSQHRTLREVSTAANVSLGYLSEIERGQKEASSELLAAICDALGAQLSELLREVSHTVAVAERINVPAGRAPLVPTADRVLVGSGADGAEFPSATPPAPPAAPAIVLPVRANAKHRLIDGDVAVSVHQNGPLKATLRTTRNVRKTDRNRDMVGAV
jgi:transcriptional regulator with XRE-family HTH domain